MENSSEFLRYLALVSDHAYDNLRVRKVVIDPDADSITVEFVLSYEDFNSLGDDDKAKIDAAVKTVFGDFSIVKTLYRKNLLSKEAVAQLVRRYIGENNRALFAVLGEQNTVVEVSDDGISVIFEVPPSVETLLVSSGCIEGLTACLESNYDCAVNVSTRIVDAIVVNERAAEEIQALVIDDHIVSYKLGLRVCGSEIRSAPKYISTFKAPQKYVCLVGEVSGMLRAVSRKSGYIYYAFTLGDTTATINCRYFTRRSDKGPLDCIHDGDSVIVSGDIIEDGYSHGITLNVRTMWTCTIDYSSIVTEKEGGRRPKPHRELKPEKIELLGQQNLFELDAEPTPMLRGRTYVVFDLETTGLDTETCSIVEICGVKIVDGVISNSISTLVDPGIHIPEDASATNHIYDDDVRDAPYIEDVLPQFAAWVGDAALVAHNGFAYDYKVLDSVGARCGVSFAANKKYDTILMSSVWHSKTGINRKLNLGQMCNEFGIELTNAHRAFFDTLATAQLFVKLCEKMDGLGVSERQFSR